MICLVDTIGSGWTNHHYVKMPIVFIMQLLIGYGVYLALFSWQVNVDSAFVDVASQVAFFDRDLLRPLLWTLYVIFVTLYASKNLNIAWSVRSIAVPRAFRLQFTRMEYKKGIPIMQSSSNSNNRNSVPDLQPSRKIIDEVVHEDVDPYFIEACRGDLEEGRRKYMISLQWRRDHEIDTILLRPHPHFTIVCF